MEKNKTIKQIESNNSWDNRENVLVFSYNEVFIKKFTDIAFKRFPYSVYSLQNLDLFLIKLYFEKFQVIYLDIDSIFYKLHEVLTHIQHEDSKNKSAKIYLMTSAVENASKLKKLGFSKNIISLLNGEEMLYLQGGENIFVKNFINLFIEKY